MKHSKNESELDNWYDAKRFVMRRKLIRSVAHPCLTCPLPTCLFCVRFNIACDRFLPNNSFYLKLCINPRILCRFKPGNKSPPIRMPSPKHRFQTWRYLPHTQRAKQDNETKTALHFRRLVLHRGNASDVCSDSSIKVV